MKRILVVDDEKQVRLLLRKTLERAGYEIEEACDGMESLEICRRNTIDLVITDIIMQEKEGIETIIDIKREFPDIQLIAISGGGRVGPKNYLSMAGRFGAVRTFSKPVNHDDLLNAIRELLGTEAPQL